MNEHRFNIGKAIENLTKKTKLVRYFTVIGTDFLKTLNQYMIIFYPNSFIYLQIVTAPLNCVSK